jgi:uncharacterized protein YcnI
MHISSLRMAALSALLASTSVGAFAHATLEQGEAPVKGMYKAVMRVPHGCEGAATLKVRIQIPEGVISVKPMPKAGWTLETVKGPYAKTYDLWDTKVSEGVKEVTWSGELLDEHYDEFIFRGYLSDQLPPDTMLYFPTVQECASAAERWIEIPAVGQNPDDLKYPAPGVKLLPAKAGH